MYLSFFPRRTCSTYRCPFSSPEGPPASVFLIFRRTLVSMGDQVAGTPHPENMSRDHEVTPVSSICPSMHLRHNIENLGGVHPYQTTVPRRLGASQAVIWHQISAEEPGERYPGKVSGIGQEGTISEHRRKISPERFKQKTIRYGDVSKLTGQRYSRRFAR